jgi:endonuclease/exonuclease/phosphatase family metal-dependent hydrolase
MTSRIILAVLLGLFVVNTQAKNLSKKKQLHIVSYNVQNLFDTIPESSKDHLPAQDRDKNDWEYVPLGTAGKVENCNKQDARYRRYCLETDWKPSRLEIKLDQIRKAILENSNSMPDMLALIEVENSDVVEMLKKELGYDHFAMTTSPDKRGIDVALLYNLKEEVEVLNKEKVFEEHVVHGDYTKNFPTRNILEVRFLVKGAPLSIFVNHWPSQRGPTAARADAANTVKNVVNKRKAEGQKFSAIVLGDFNVVPKNDNPNPLKTVLESGKNPLSNVHELFLNARSISKSSKSKLSKGTYFYKKDYVWNMLDLFYITQNLRNGQGLDIDLSSYEIYNKGITTSFTVRKPGDPRDGQKIRKIPLRYRHTAATAAKAGFSDHFPISIKLKY